MRRAAQLENQGAQGGTPKFSATQRGDGTPQGGALDCTGRHYTPAEIAELWSLSVDEVRNIFRREPGVLVIGDEDPPRGRRRYTTLRIPESVLLRVHRRLKNV